MYFYMAKSCSRVPKLTNMRCGGDPSFERLFGKPGSPPAYQTSTKAPPIPLQLESSTLIFNGNFPYFVTFLTFSTTGPVLSVELPGYDRWARCAGPVHSFLGRLAAHNFFLRVTQELTNLKKWPLHVVRGEFAASRLTRWLWGEEHKQDWEHC